MKPAIRNQTDFLSGLIFGGVGVTALAISRDLSFGTLAQVGPGFFPTVAAVGLCMVALILLVRSVTTGESETITLAPLPIAVICGAALLFAVLLRPLGLLPAAVIVVLVSTLASRSLGWVAAVTLAVAISGFVTLIFVAGLGLQAPILGTWLSGLI
jgi:hypothetical protein